MRRWGIILLVVLLSVEEGETIRKRRYRRRKEKDTSVVREKKRRRRYRRRKEKVPPVVREKKEKKLPTKRKKLITIMPTVNLGMDYCFIGDYNSYQQSVKEDTVLPDFLPPIHWFSSGEIGVGVIYNELVGGGVSLGIISRGSEPAEWEKVEVIEGDSCWFSGKYQFAPSSTYLLFNFYLLPPLKVPVIRFTTGLGIYFASCDLLTSTLMKIPALNLSGFKKEEGNLSATGIGFHIGSEVSYPLFRNFLVGIDARFRVAKVKGFKGKCSFSEKIQIGSYTVKTDSTFTGELVYQEDKEGDVYFGIGDSKKENTRPGVVDFSGFKFGANLIFRF